MSRNRWALGASLGFVLMAASAAAQTQTVVADRARFGPSAVPPSTTAPLRIGAAVDGYCDATVSATGELTLDCTGAGQSVTVSDAFVATAAASLTGSSLTLGDASTDILTLTARLGSSSLLWSADGGGSIGAAGANRPANLYTSGLASIGSSLAVGTTLNVTGATTLSSTLDARGTISNGGSTNGGVVYIGDALTATGATVLQSTLDVQGTVQDSTSDVTFADNVALATPYYVASDNYASQTAGWRVTYPGSADFRYLFTDELHAKSFIADLEQALAGGQIISKSVAMVTCAGGSCATKSQAFQCPVSGGTATLWVRDLPSAANMAAFVAGDFIMLRTFTRATGTLTIGDCVGTVANYADGSGANDGLQSWTFTRGTGSNGGSVSEGTWVGDDSLALDFGTSGNGFYEVSAVDGAYGVNSPYAQVVTWATSPVALNRTVRGRFGNLTGSYGYTCGSPPCVGNFGLAFGDPSATNLTAESTNGVRIRYGSTTKAAWDASGNITIGEAANENVYITATAVELRDGATAYGTLSGSTLTLGPATNEDKITIDPTNGVRFYNSSNNVVGQILGTLWQIGQDANDQTRLTLDATNGLRVISDVSGTDTTKFQVDLGGKVWLQSNATSAAYDTLYSLNWRPHASYPNDTAAVGAFLVSGLAWQQVSSLVKNDAVGRVAGVALRADNQTAAGANNRWAELQLSAGPSTDLYPGEAVFNVDNFQIGVAGRGMTVFQMDAGYPNDVPSISLTGMWNSAGTTMTALRFNMTDIASATDSMLLRLSVGSADKWVVRKDGATFERGRTTALGEWASPSYASGNFSSDSGTWAVDAGDVVTYKYTLIGKTMTVSWLLQNATLTGTPTYLYIKIPDGKLANGSQVSTARHYLPGVGWGIGECYTANDTWIRLIPKADNTVWAAGDIFTQGTCAFEVQ